MVYQQLLEAALTQDCINTHCHLDAALPPPASLPDFLKKSYLNWQFKDSIKPTMSKDAFIRLVGCNSYFYGLAQTLGALYNPTGAPLDAHNWETIEAALVCANAQPGHTLQLLQEKCHYQAVILDLQNSPGGDNRLPGFFRPALRCDMFIRGNANAGTDANGNNPRLHMQAQGSLGFADYLQEVEHTLERAAATGVVAIKLAIAYERGLDFAPTQFAAAQRGYLHAGATPSETKACEDYITLALCCAAGRLRLPVQVHTGMGGLYRTNALWLKPLIDACPATQFVLLHCSYPHTRDCMALLHEYSNVFADLSWLPLISPIVAQRMLEELLDVTDSGRLAWGCDTETPEESMAAHSLFCQTLAGALAAKVRQGYYSIAYARQLIACMMFDNPNGLYRCAPS